MICVNLKQSIVIRNEFSNKFYGEGGRSLGSRGGSFQAYIIGYMARDMASDGLFPLEHDEDLLFDESYNQRVTERVLGKMSSLTEDTTFLDQISSRALKYDGLAFDDKALSMSYEEVYRKSQQIQNAFEAGHSVQKFIISFTDDYLKEMGVLPENFELQERGDHFGNVDQLKLRQAIQDGMGAMMREGAYEDPAWIGLIQLDTKHVHAHMVACDQVFANQRLKEDGLDRGKIYANEKTVFRQACHQSLERQLDLAHTSDQVRLLNFVLDNDLLANVVDAEKDTIEQKQKLEDLVMVVDEPELVYQTRKQKVEQYFKEIFVQPENHSGVQADELLGLKLAFQRMFAEYDLEDEDEAIMEDLWVQTASDLFLEDVQEVDDVQAFGQLLRYSQNRNEEDIVIVDQLLQQVSGENSRAFLNFLKEELSGYYDRSLMLEGNGYDEKFVASRGLEKESRLNAMKRQKRLEQLTQLAGETSVSSSCAKMMQRISKDSNDVFIGGNVLSTDVTMYFREAFDRTHWPIVIRQLENRDHSLSSEAVVSQLIDTLSSDSSYVDIIEVPDNRDVEEIKPIEVGIVTRDDEKVDIAEEIITTENEAITERDAPIDDKNDENEFIEDADEGLYKDGLTFAQYMALHPELFEEDEPTSTNEKDDDLEL